MVDGDDRVGYTFKEEKATKLLDELDTLWKDATEGAHYIQGYMDMGPQNEGLNSILTGGHSTAKEKVDDMLSQLGKYFKEELGDNLADTFRLYRTQQEDTQAKLESIEGSFENSAERVRERRETSDDLSANEQFDSYKTHIDLGNSKNPFEAPENPRKHFKDVDIGDDSVYKPTSASGVLDYFSITYWLRNVAGLVIPGWDPMDHLGRILAEDWDQYTLISKALDKTSHGVSDIGTNLAAHAEQLDMRGPATLTWPAMRRWCRLRAQSRIMPKSSINSQKIREGRRIRTRSGVPRDRADHQLHNRYNDDDWDRYAFD